MPLFGHSLIALLCLSAGSALAQEGKDPLMMEQGAALYAQNCMLCHGDAGQGTTDVFPPLAGSQTLDEPGIIVGNILQGVVTMPPFPWLADAEIAALATYVRNSFGNTHGGVSSAEVTTVRATLAPQGTVRTIWDGVYTQEQADLGRGVYGTRCALCHGSRLNGDPDNQYMRPSPPLVRADFLRTWDGRSLGTLYSYARWTMPQNDPGILTDEDYLEIIAYILSGNRAPPGDMPLSLDIHELALIRFGPKP